MYRNQLIKASKVIRYYFYGYYLKKNAFIEGAKIKEQNIIESG